MSIGSIEPQFYAELLRLTGLADDPEFADQMDQARWPALKARLAEVFASKTRDEWCALMEHTDVCFAPVLTMAEAAEHPHNVAPRDDRRRRRASSSRRRRPASAARRPELDRPPAHPGQHTREVLEDWGVPKPTASTPSSSRAPSSPAADVPSRMATLVFVHAHPDDEASLTSGSMARAAAEGHRVVLVVATDGDHGESPDDLAPGETLVDRRQAETARSADVLGVARVVWLGYHDSGMTGLGRRTTTPPRSGGPTSDEAAERLADILREEHADVVVLYDWHGGYGHPDHIQVHRVGHRAADLAGTPRRFEATYNRDAVVAWMDDRRRRRSSTPTGPSDDGNPLGTPEAELHLAVDVSAYIDRKRAALAAHASQVTDIGMFLSMPDDVFRRWPSRPSGSSSRAPRRACARGWLLGRDRRLMARLHLVRHGRATAGWDVDPDPGLDHVGRRAGGRGWSSASLRSAPAGRDQPAATVPGDGGAAGRRGGASTPAIEPTVAEIPSPLGVPMGERVAWLRRRWRARGPTSASGGRPTATRCVAWVAARRPRTSSSSRTSSPSTP